jgi:hypothetical protein
MNRSMFFDRIAREVDIIKEPTFVPLVKLIFFLLCLVQCSFGRLIFKHPLK